MEHVVYLFIYRRVLSRPFREPMDPALYCHNCDAPAERSYCLPANVWHCIFGDPINTFHLSVFPCRVLQKGPQIAVSPPEVLACNWTNRLPRAHVVILTHGELRSFVFWTCVSPNTTTATQLFCTKVWYWVGSSRPCRQTRSCHPVHLLTDSRYGVICNVGKCDSEWHGEYRQWLHRVHLHKFRLCFF